MATGMNTDYPLVPIRKYLDTIEDMVVPSSLSKVPGRTSRHLPLSPFERLPLELRQEIYGRLGFLIGGKVWRYYYPGRVYYRATVRYFLFPRWDLRPGGSYDVMYATEHPSMQSECYGSNEHLWWPSQLLFVSKGIRREVWDTMFQSTDVAFGFQVSSKAVHFSDPHGGWNYGNDRPKGFYRMHLKAEQFANLTRVTLTEKCGHTYSTDNPHRMAKVSPRSILVRQAHSVRYIADHCPFLTQIRIQPYLQGSVTWSSRKRRGLRGVAPKSTEALIQAIVYLSEKCEYLETIYIRAVVEVHRTEDCYLDQKQCRLNSRFGSCMCRDQDYGYLLEEMSWLERLDGVEMWVRCFLDRLRMHKPVWELEE